MFRLCMVLPRPRYSIEVVLSKLINRVGSGQSAGAQYSWRCENTQQPQGCAPRSNPSTERDSGTNGIIDDIALGAGGAARSCF